VSETEGKTNFSRRLKQSDGLTWLTPTPIFYDRSTPLLSSISFSPCPTGWTLIPPCRRRRRRRHSSFRTTLLSRYQNISILLTVTLLSLSLYWSWGWWRRWVVTTGAIRRAKLQLNLHHQHRTFYRPDALPGVQPTVRELKEKNVSYSTDLLTLRSPTLFLTTKVFGYPCRKGC